MADEGSKSAGNIAEDVKGKTKEVAGEVLGQDSLEREGKATQKKVDADEEAAQRQAEADKARAEEREAEAEERAAK